MTSSTPSPRRVYRHADLQRVISPRSVAIVGISPNETTHAGRTLKNLKDFDGDVFLVNSKYDRIGDRSCYPSIEALPKTPDCAVLAIGRDTVEPVVRECAARGVGGAIIYAGGYIETGEPERIAQQARLGEISSASGLRIIGPNTVGIMNHARRFAMNFSSELKLAPQTPWAIGLISQSGGMGNGLTQSLHRGIPISHTLTAGNSVDIDVADYVAYLAEDPACRVIALAFEGIESAARLIEAGEIAWKADKPLVVLKLAKGGFGAEAAMSHTGFLAGSQESWQAVFERIGAVTVEGFDALIDTAAFLAKARRPAARGLAVASQSGGAAISAADEAEARGVSMPQPGEAAKAKILEVMPRFGLAKNPCDITAQVKNDVETFSQCAEALMADPAYGAVLMPYLLVKDPPDRVINFGNYAEKYGKLALVVYMSEWLAGPGHRELIAMPNAATFRSMSVCMDAVAGWLKREDRRAEGERSVPRVSDAKARAAAAKLIAASSNATLTERESKEVLAAYGVPVVGERLVQSAADAVAAAKALGLPVALKVESPDLPHKTEAGVIRLNLKDDAEVKAGYEAVMTNANKVSPKPRINGVLVQPMVPTGAEIVVGAKIDPLFGPLSVVGLGGVFVELLQDSAVALAPVNKAEAREMLRRLKGRKLLEGFRGSEAVDEEKLADIIVRLSEFAADHKDTIAELDVNPLICAGSRIVAVDALIVKK